MKRRHALVLASCTFMVAGLACVDLFHGTDFDTFCTRSPNDPQCGGEASVTPDAPVDAPKDVARPRTDFCVWSPEQAHQQALRACAFLGACEGPLGESTFGSCVFRALLAFDCKANPSLRPGGAAEAFWSCLSAVKSCSDVDACVFPGGVQDCVAVPSGSSLACGTLAANSGTRLKCQGDAGRAVGVEPCAMFGKTCAVETTSVASCSGPLTFDKCTTTGCTGASAVDCTQSGSRKLDRGVDCASFGKGTCVVEDGGPVCEGTGEVTCTADSMPRCDGSSVTTCVSGKEIRIDCAALGTPCDVSAPVSPYDPSAACDGRNTGLCVGVDKCVGNVMQSCARGELYELDCTSVGFPTCKIGPSGNAACSN